MKSTRYALLLRGINVGRNHRMPMAELRELLGSLGLEDVATHLQSGNALVTSTLGPTALRELVEPALEERFGFTSPVVVRTSAELDALVEADPLGTAATDPRRSVVHFLSRAPGAAAIRALTTADWGDEQIAVHDREVLSWCPQSQLRSPLVQAITKAELAPVVTARNWRTVLRVAELARLATLVGALVLSAVVVSGCDGGDGGGDGDASRAAGSRHGSRTAATCRDDQPASTGTAGGMRVVRHCGSARATVELDGARSDLHPGACQNTPTSVVVNVGTTVVDPTATPKQRARLDYLGVLAGTHPAAAASATPAAKDGTYSTGVIISGAVGGEPFTILAGGRLTLSEGRTRGRFSGRSQEGDAVSGTFTCD